MSVRFYLKQVIESHARLTREQARDLMDQIFTEDLNDLELAALLGGLGARGETAEEVAGFVDSMRTFATPLPLTEAERARLVDTCGTGGDASGSFNISTAAALVAAAAGATVAKHGNRAVTSRCGSADVLEALGIPVNLNPEDAVAALRQHRFVFLHAPAMHPAAKAVMPVRRSLGLRTVFNILGPLTNPAGAPAQVMGVYAPHLVPLVAEAMALLGTRHSFVVYGETGTKCGMDEFSISGPSLVAEIHADGAGGGSFHVSTFSPEDFGLQRSPLESLSGGDAATNATLLRQIFAGQKGPRRDVVVLNAAAVLVTAGIVHDIAAGAERAAQTVDSGLVTELVASLTRTT